jgi:hypothetical protein
VRKLVLGCALVVASCSEATGPGPGTPATAEHVALQPGDTDGLEKCSASEFDVYLVNEKSDDPTAYTADLAAWTKLQNEGAVGAFVVQYAANTDDCQTLTASAAASGPSPFPHDKLVSSVVVEFKDSTSAATSYKTNPTPFHFTPFDVADLRMSGGTLKTANDTGLGDNSLVGYVSLPSTTSFYIAFWQKQKFEITLLAYNATRDESDRTTHLMNGRIS